MDTQSLVQWPYVLRKGYSHDPRNGACAMAAISWLVYGTNDYLPECACPIITTFVYLGNDAMDDQTRQRLIPFLHRIAGSLDPQREDVRQAIMVTAAKRFGFQPWPSHSVRAVTQAFVHGCARKPKTYFGFLNPPFLGWEPYFDTLDKVLNAGKQGEPWSADEMAAGVAEYERAIAA